MCPSPLHSSLSNQKNKIAQIIFINVCIRTRQEMKQNTPNTSRIFQHFEKNSIYHQVVWKPRILVLQQSNSKVLVSFLGLLKKVGFWSVKWLLNNSTPYVYVLFERPPSAFFFTHKIADFSDYKSAFLVHVPAFVCSLFLHITISYFSLVRALIFSQVNSSGS